MNTKTNHYHTILIKFTYFFLIVLILALTGCSQPPTPQAYLDTAVDWIAANAAASGDVDWPAVRAEAQSMIAAAQTTTDTYPAVEYVLRQLPGSITWFNTPQDTADLRHFGLSILATEQGAVVVQIDKDGPAAQAGVKLGDVVEKIEGQPPAAEDLDEPPPWFYDPKIEGETLDLEITSAGSATPKQVAISPTVWPGYWTPFGQSIANGEKSTGMLNLTLDSGTDKNYAPLVQDILASLDSTQTCGWIIDLRTNAGGDIWSYLAALGPFLGDGQMGGFQFPDGRRELWERRAGQVYWDGQKREESAAIENDYQLQNSDAPVALLISPITNLAAELTLVAFQGRDGVRSFGELTRGHPHFQAVTTLDDGAVISISGAYAFDRSGNVYKSGINPDEFVPVDWQKLGQPDDPVVQAAQSWLSAQPSCTT